MQVYSQGAWIKMGKKRKKKIEKNNTDPLGDNLLCAHYFKCNHLMQHHTDLFSDCKSAGPLKTSMKGCLMKTIPF